MKKFYITPSLQIAELYTQDGLMVNTSKQEAVDNNDGDTGDNGNGFVKEEFSSTNLWDEEW